MFLILTVDNKNGMLFDGKRQTRDRIVTNYIRKRGCGSLRISPRSADLFGKDMDGVVACGEYLSNAGVTDWCFVEDPADLSTLPEKPVQVYLIKWNRDYPGDAYMPGDLLDGMALVKTREWAGYSHEKITVEIYERQYVRSGDQ